MMGCPVALLTDFGRRDHYAGVLHAVLECIAPGVARIDLSHEIEPGDLWHACFTLVCSWPHLPEPAIVLAVVDPGVGTARRAVAVRQGRRWLVAPDNGLATAVGRPDEAVELDWRRWSVTPPSATFHGRDVFAPAAAKLAAGTAASLLGAPLDPSVLMPCPLPRPEPVGGGFHAVVIHVDRFGNVVTNVPASRLHGVARVDLGVLGSFRQVTTYGEAPAGEVVVLEGSSGYLELAVNQGSAARALGVACRDELVMRFAS
jgi:S-adenosylmethionine hydrolase